MKIDKAIFVQFSFYSDASLKTLMLYLLFSTLISTQHTKRATMNISSAQPTKEKVPIKSSNFPSRIKKDTYIHKRS